MNCPLKEKGCGGCTGIERMYGALLREKEAQFRRLFPQALPMIGMEDPRFYRNKVLRAYANGRSSLYHGIYRRQTHQIVSVKYCLLENKRANEIANIVLELLTARRIPAWREDFHRGVIRHLQIHRAHVTGQALVTLVTGSEELPGGEEIARQLMQKCPDVRGVIQNINSRDSSAVLGFRNKLLAGRDEIWDEMCGLHVCLTSRAFYQVNTVQAEKLYAKAIEFAALTPQDTVLDAYCGVGMIGMLAAAKSGQVVGIELVRDAVECARRAARVNRIDNIRFICGDACKALQDEAFKPSVVFLDPPRAGCSQAFLEALAHNRPDRIVYVSCCPETLRRDADILECSGYRPEKIQPIDLFPYTAHTEAVSLFTRV